MIIVFLSMKNQKHASLEICAKEKTVCIHAICDDDENGAFEIHDDDENYSSEEVERGRKDICECFS